MAISIADNFSYKGSKPLDARFQFSSVASMKDATTSDLYDGCWAYVTANKKYYSYDSSNTVDETTGKWREYSSGGGGSYTAGDGIDITNNVISTDNMSSEDMTDVVTPLPSVSVRRFKYSTDEQIVGEWIDGKPLYEITYEYTNSGISSTTAIIDLASNIVVRNIKGILCSTDGRVYMLPYSAGNSTTSFRVNTSNQIEVVLNNDSWSNSYTPWYITIQYTKTTD